MVQVIRYEYHTSNKYSADFNHPLSSQANKWMDGGACRKVFDAFAAAEGKDPLNPEMWYSARLKKILKYKSKNHSSMSRWL